MSALSTLLRNGTDLAAATGVLYAAGVASTAAVSVFSRDRQRRRDARETLMILLRRRDTR
ncbi:hypothetical protein ACFWIQ_38305 [Kitasatospora sp. NPDC127059]|uniref:hypothetical protein n=1 Tax=unclassified Kitasatospora TaxID=2633591 RepID=UPI00365F3959